MFGLQELEIKDEPDGGYYVSVAAVLLFFVTGIRSLSMRIAILLRMTLPGLAYAAGGDSSGGGTWTNPPATANITKT